MPTWSGKTLGNVVIGELIARGGMAEVYYGTHSTLKRNVAVKIMRDHVEEDPDSQARFAREARVIASLDHKNIIQIYDYSLVDDRPCIVMELVSGFTLAAYLKAAQERGEKLPAETMTRLLTSIASAMDYAHELNIVHRDIKPANILLRSKGGPVNLDEPLPADVEPVLTDFGLVRLLDSSIHTTTGTVSGTPAYMSPEQARGDRVDRRTDIYALGVLVYEMMAGGVPFEAESSFGVLLKHMNEPPPPIAGISHHMQTVIDRALAKDPAHRYETAGRMVEEFIAVLNGKPVSEETEKIGDALKEEFHRKPSSTPSRLPFFAGVFLILALIIFAGIRIFRPAAQPPLDPNQAVGRITYIDFNYVMDRALISINGLPQPKPGSHYEVWLVAQGGKERRNIGAINFDGEGGHASYTSPNSNNLLSLFDQIDVTIEPDNAPNPDVPSGEVVASSVFPPQALIEVRHVLVAIGGTPDGDALIQGLYWTADAVNTSMTDLGEAFAKGDEETLRLKTEEVINEISGSENRELYKDWNGDGEIADVSNGYGLLANGSERGYIPQTIGKVNSAAEASDAAQNILENSAKVIACAENMQSWNEQLLALALKLQDMPIGPGMESVIAEMSALSKDMLYGVDANGNKRIEPIIGEGGADTAYEFAYLMAEMPLLPGPNRIPLPGK